jgi:cysteinyl-tRNA synthetase
MSELKVYNSLTRQKEVFTPLYPGHVGMYVCGPTVSGESHLGHARPYITFDVVNRYLQHLGYKVRYVRNITDAGHFEEEGKEAEDKISSKAQLEKLEPMELVQKYTNLFHWAMLRFNNLEPSIEPTATGHIIEQIEMIKTIVEKGYAYEANGSVYFDVKKYAASHDYGILSGRVLEDMLESSNRELENQDEKRNNVDFALWKNAPPKHLMRWPSPWGEGFPGWHIECSAMSSKYLGKQFDIHGGGIDLQFPHHECEIAQSEIAHGELMARYWLHNNMITIDGRKMGKSYGNTIKLTEMFSGDNFQLEKAYSPMTIRFFILQTHYRSTLDFSNDALQAAEKGLARLWAAYEVLQKLTYTPVEGALNEELEKQVRTWCEECTEFMNDDFNTAKVLANMFEMTPVVNSLKSGQIRMNEITADTFELLKKTWQTFLIDILALVPENLFSDNNTLDGIIQVIIGMRKEAKARKDYAASDKIRNQLLEVGVQLKDEKDGTVSYTIQ